MDANRSVLKRVLSVLMMLCLLVAAVSLSTVSPAFAEETSSEASGTDDSGTDDAGSGDEETADASAEALDIDWSALGAPEDLAGAYIEDVLYASDSEDSSSPDLSSIEGNEQALELYEELAAFLAQVSDEGGSTAFIYTFPSIYLGSGTLDEVLPEAYASLQVEDVLACLVEERPEVLYWFDRDADAGVMLSCSGTELDGYATVSSITLSFSVLADYAVLGEDGSAEQFVMDGTLPAAAAAAVSAAQKIVASNAICKVEARLDAYRDIIMELATPASEDGEVSVLDAWDVVLMLAQYEDDEGTEAAAETAEAVEATAGAYAGAFQYLCDLTWPEGDPVSCLTISGTRSMGGIASAHVWNIVSVEAGNYVVDVAGCDAVDDADDLFLVGPSADGSASGGYTVTLSDNSVVFYAYGADDLSELGEDVLTLAAAAFPELYDHDYDEGTVTSEATCTEEGTITYTCRNDSSHTYIETIPAGHEWAFASAIWEWADDYSSATVSVPCAEGDAVETIEAEVTAAADDDGAITFTATATLDGTELTDSASPAKFLYPDVTNSSSYYFEAVYALWEDGYLLGRSDGTFGVGVDMTRADFVTLLWRIACPDAYASYDASTVTDTTGFSDASDYKYYTAAMNWAKSKGVVAGYSDGSFGMGDPITFEQMCTIIARYVDEDGLEDISSDDAAEILSGFADTDDVSSWAVSSMAWCVSNGLVSGYSRDGTLTLDPVETVNRERVATVVWRALEADIL